MNLYFVWITEGNNSRKMASFVEEKDANEYRDNLRRVHPTWHVEINHSFDKPHAKV
jgi:hypothetical protein